MHFAVLRICQAAIVKTYIVILGLSACQKMLVFIPAASVKAIFKSRVNARVLPGDVQAQHLQDKYNQRQKILSLPSHSRFMVHKTFHNKTALQHCP